MEGKSSSAPQKKRRVKKEDQVGYLGLRAARLPRLDDKRGCLNRAAVLGVCGLSESGSSCDGGDGSLIAAQVQVARGREGGIQGRDAACISQWHTLGIVEMMEGERRINGHKR